jgi:EAL and modified HD-GYP domain-containing signal transduction protein
MIEVFVARQPIFDASDRCAGYELLYRGHAAATGAGGVAPDQMSADVILHSVLAIGLEQLTGAAPAFLNFTREMLLGGFWKVLDPGAVVLELLEDVEPDAEVVAACAALTDAGYRLALDDFVYSPAYDPLLARAEIVKVDVLGRTADEITEALRPLAGARVRLLAERVETREVHEACRALGFELFQGYFYSRPETLSRRELSLEQIAIMRLMNLVHDETTSELELEDAFRADPALAYKLLLMANAAALGSRGIDSIHRAVRLVGRETLHRWLALLLVSSVAGRGGTAAELMQGAVQRARLCELIVETAGRGAAAGPHFMVGLFSRIDALLGLPMDEILARVELAPEIRDALLHRGGPYAEPLALAEAYEGGRWDTVSAQSAQVGVQAAEMPELYVQSLAWARTRLAAAT